MLDCAPLHLSGAAAAVADALGGVDSEAWPLLRGFAAALEQECEQPSSPLAAVGALSTRQLLRLQRRLAFCNAEEGARAVQVALPRKPAALPLRDRTPLAALPRIQFPSVAFCRRRCSGATFRPPRASASRRCSRSRVWQRTPCRRRAGRHRPCAWRAGCCTSAAWRRRWTRRRTRRSCRGPPAPLPPRARTPRRHFLVRCYPAVDRSARVPVVRRFLGESRALKRGRFFFPFCSPQPASGARGA